MGILSDLIAIKDIQKLMRGEVASLSVSQITGTIINLPQAEKNLNKEQFDKVYSLFKELRRDKLKKRMVLEGYYNIAMDIIKKFEEVAPYEKYSGINEHDFTILMQQMKSKSVKNKLEEDYADEEAEYVNYIVDNSNGIISEDTAKKITKIIKKYTDEGKEKALQEFDLLVNNLIKSNDSFNAIAKMSFLAGLLNKNGVISDIEMKELTEKYQQTILNFIMNAN